MKKVIIFDMDGTLLNTLTDLSRSTNFALEQMGYPQRSSDEIRRFIGNGVANLIRCAVPEGTDERETIRALEIFADHYNQYSHIDTHPYPGVQELLKKLKSLGYITAIVSNKFDGAVKDLNHRWFGVDIAIGESENLRRKPAPDMVFAALKELGAGHEDAVYVGDTEVDLMTANNSGCKPLLVSWGYRSKSELMALGDYAVADSAADVLRLIEALG